MTFQPDDINGEGRIWGLTLEQRLANTRHVKNALAEIDEIEPGDREDLQACVEYVLTALTELREVLAKPVVEGKVA
jgi:hypothetical protein